MESGAFAGQCCQLKQTAPVLRRGGEAYEPAKLTLSDCEAPFESEYMYELQLPGAKGIHCKKLSVDSDRGFVEIDLPCDCAQVYRDRKLIADWFWCGVPQQLPARLLFGGECFLFWSEMGGGIYTETGRMPD